MVKMNYTKKLVLADGEEYYGFGFGADVQRTLEVVFNTSMAGYQEIMSDPSYTDQGVVMTYPLMGNYGMADGDYETQLPTIGALIVREYNDEPSNFRSSETLGQVMARYNIPGIQGVDTRKLTRSIRDKGSRRGVLTAADTPVEEVLRLISETPIPHDAVSRVSRQAICSTEVADADYHVVAVDCGMKENIVRSLNRRGCDVTIVPWNTPASVIEELQPDGVFFSNGPGNPTDVLPTIDTIRSLRGKYPIFGICLGHQLIALSYGAKTYKLKFGHRGGNHPVRDLVSGRVEITSQNHSYAVDAGSLEGTPLQVTHINILDNTVEGLACPADKIFSVQYHPESAPGPQDSWYLFDRFIAMMEEERGHA